MGKNSERGEAKEGRVRNSRLAVVSILCTVIVIFSAVMQSLVPTYGLFFSGLFIGFALVGLLTAFESLQTIRMSYGQIKGRTMAGIAAAVNAALLSLVMLGALIHFAVEKHNDRCWAGLNQIKDLGRAIGEYERSHGGCLPDANRWCDELLGECKWLHRDNFVHPLRKCDTCSFAFNRAISGLPADKIDPNVAILFEAEGSWNLNGGPELLKKRKNLDSYVLLVSGRAYRYSFTDMGIEQYNTNSHEFYIGPLIWEPNFSPKSSRIK